MRKITGFFLTLRRKPCYSSTHYSVYQSCKHILPTSFRYFEAAAPKKFDFPPYYSKFPIISRSYIKPKCISEELQQTYYLTPWALAFLSINYIQCGFLFSKPLHLPMESIVDHLKDSLSHTLTHFFPLAGRLDTKRTCVNPPSYSVSVNCTDCRGAEFIHAVAKEVTSAQVTALYRETNTPSLIESLCPFKGFMDRGSQANIGLINHDGHTLPLLVVQVIELVDGVFLGVAINHCITDGGSFWHFFQSWSEISSKMMVETSIQDKYTISRPPIIKNWCTDNHGPIFNLPSDYYYQISQNAPPPPPLYWDGVFHFSAQSIARLKAQANAECCNANNNISSFQALNAFIWRCLTRARRLPANQETSCLLAVSDRPKLNPSPSQDHLGCFVQVLSGTATAGELLANNLGWSAMVLHKAVNNHNSEKVDKFLKDWSKCPSFPQIFGENSMLVENSPRYDAYYDFGWGKPITVRTGFGNKADGTIFVFPGHEGGGSLDVEMFLSPDSMSALLSDAEFMSVVSF